ncbi:class I adenylate-forming enzyme family protein [Halomonas korlensis]|uniref:Acyl-CoA synthetase (AMP-forming)/AMP-acid ligase II n=1 Tax=Halomonas korlensis TaxID=463301 RepID=A0A1I7GIF2_9GAMM|nr:AMP-binding protein [Halomonas korlensis]SFU48240.1 Acyl-CoA synthetase (AMP-forming)/AMP-acid ligase II [Halomonas korlensis]
MVSDLERNLIERVAVGDILTRSADLFPDRPALIEAIGVLSYHELATRSDRLGHALLALSLKRQDVVAVMAGNCRELLIIYFACAKAGLVCLPVNLGMRSQEIAYCLNDARAKLLIAEAGLIKTARPLPEQVPSLKAVYRIGGPSTEVAKSADSFEALLAGGRDGELEVVIGDRDPVQLLYTSGTTAAPKGVLTSHLAVTLAAMSNALANRMSHETTILGVLPLFHVAQLNATSLPVLLAGGTLVLERRFEAARAAELIERHGISMLVLLPVMYAALQETRGGRPLPSVTRAIYTIATMPVERLEVIHSLFPLADVVSGAGLTELPRSTYQRPEHQWSKAASWGSATAITRIAIMDGEGRRLPRGEVGEIVYRGPQVMNGYLNMLEKTAEAFAHGWLHSGDLGWIDNDGVVWFTDRKKDLIKTGGENVASVEIERCLLKHPAVSEAAVVGVPHPRWNEAVVAVVIPKPGEQVDEAGLIAHCREHLAGFKLPKAVRIMESLPRTGNGKVQKQRIRSELIRLFAGTED